MHAWCAQIPHSLGTLAKLEELNLSNNCFEGSLPPSMAALTTLNTFSASNNELSGDLPPFLGELSLLTCLALDGNSFGGTIPRELGKLVLLKRLYLERNELVSVTKHAMLVVLTQGSRRSLSHSAARVAISFSRSRESFVVPTFGVFVVESTTRQSYFRPL